MTSGLTPSCCQKPTSLPIHAKGLELLPNGRPKATEILQPVSPLTMRSVGAAAWLAPLEAAGDPPAEAGALLAPEDAAAVAAVVGAVVADAPLQAATSKAAEVTRSIARLRAGC